MKIDLYKSVKNPTKYLSVPAGTDVASRRFLANLDSDLLLFSPFNTSVDIQPGINRAALDSTNVIQQISDKGFAIHIAATTVTIVAVPK